MLTATQWELQRAGGTWSTLFNRTAWVNSSDVIAVLVWYLFFSAIGVAFFPLTRLVFAGLRDKGFGISRLFGLLVIGVVVWLSVSLGVPYTHQTILIVLAAAAFFNLILFVKNKNDILKQLHDDWKLFLQAETLFLGLFLFFLLIRLGNPDLWHPSKGGEKPMDFSYFNAILKSASFPPYDPWFAGGKLNYYYYGAYLAGLGVKALGIIPSVAYNLILPLWYALLGSAFYAAITSLSLHVRGTSNQDSSAKSKRVGIIGIFGVLIAQVFGNLGIPAMVAKELVELGGVSTPETATFLELAGAFFVGIARMLQGTPFQMYRGDWYWVPSRAIPGEPITEFPYFTFLYGDPHAHLYALPITVLVLCWLSSLVILTQNKRKWTFTGLLPVFWGGVVLLGSLIPTNTWDFPTYLLLTIALFFALMAIVLIYIGKPETRLQCLVLLAGIVFLVAFAAYLDKFVFFLKGLTENLGLETIAKKMDTIYILLTENTATGNASDRMNLYGTSLSTFFDHPLTGMIFVKESPIGRIGFHSEFCDLLGGIGLIGLSSLAFFLYERYAMIKLYIAEEFRWRVGIITAGVFLLAVLNQILYAPQISMNAFLMPTLLVHMLERQTV